MMIFNTSDDAESSILTALSILKQFRHVTNDSASAAAAASTISPSRTVTTITARVGKV